MLFTEIREKKRNRLVKRLHFVSVIDMLDGRVELLRFFKARYQKVFHKN